MKDFLTTPWVVPGIILIAGCLFLSTFINQVEDTTNSMLLIMGCCIGIYVGVQPILRYIHDHHPIN